MRLALWWDRHRGVEQLEDLKAERERLAEADLDAGAVKLMVDGVSETFTMAVDEPYLGGARCPCDGGERGLAFLEPEQLDEAVVALDAAGFQAHFHALGDRAVRTALDAVAAARRANGWSNQRHQLAHLQPVAPQDRNRFRLLGAIANVEGMWARHNTPAVQTPGAVPRRRAAAVAVPVRRHRQQRCPGRRRLRLADQPAGADGRHPRPGEPLVASHRRA